MRPDAPGGSYRRRHRSISEQGAAHGPLAAGGDPRTKPPFQFIAIATSGGILGALRLGQLPLRRVANSLGDLQSGLFVTEVGLNVGDAFLRRLSLTATMIGLLLKGAWIDSFPL